MEDKQNHTFDSVYNDPSASATLVSSDEVYFKVDPYPLKKGSNVLCAMLSDSDLTPSPIPIDLESDDLRTLLSFLDFAEPIVPSSPTGWRMLLDMSDKFDCPPLKDRIRDYAKLMAFHKPWESFCLASHLNDDGPQKIS